MIQLACSYVFIFFEESECANAAKNYDFVQPRNRQFVMLEPTIDRTTRKTPIVPLTLSTSKASKKPATIVPLVKSQSRRSLWIFIGLSFCVLLCYLGFLGYKRIRSMLHPDSSNGDHSQPSNRDGSLASVRSSMTSTYPDTKPIDTSTIPHDPPKSSPATTKVRSQHLRLGLLEDD